MYILNRSATGSILRSLLSIEDIVEASKHRGFASIIDTDGLFSAPQFIRLCEKEGIKPIVGLVVDVEDCKFCVVARDNIGYDTLVKLASLKYSGEVLTIQLFLGSYSDHLICLWLGIGDDNKAKIVFEHFGDNFYTVVDPIVRVDVPFGQEICDYWSFYNHPGDYKYYEILRGIRKNEEVNFDVNAVGPNSLMQFSNEIYFDNFVAKIESYGLSEHKVKLPSTNISNDEFISLIKQKFDEYIASKQISSLIQEEYTMRLYYELDVIVGFGYVDYFMIVADMIRHTNENLLGYYSAGRGSVGGSLVAFLLGITRVDPVRPPGFDMSIPFDRFLNSGRKTMPDIDMDFLPQDRAYVIEYLRYKYGVDSVMNICTINTLGPKAAMREVGRITGLLDPYVESVIDAFPKDQHLTLELVKASELYNLNIKNDKFARIFDIAEKLEGIPRAIGIHASGIALTDGSMMDRVPIYKQSEGRAEATQYDQDSLEYMGIVKLDVLGLNTLKNIKDTLDMLGDRFTFKDLNNINLEDPKVFELINQNLLAGVFQWDTYNYKKVITDLKPSSFKELVDLNTLGRSAALLSGLTDSYIRRKYGLEAVEPIHPKLLGLMNQTYELPLYQEQMMYLFVNLAGYSMSEADDVRKAIGKKLPELMAKQKDKFKDRCLERGLSIEEVDHIWFMIDKFSKYTWNIGHAIAYTKICYETAYLATHFPAEYYSACSLNAKDTDKTAHFVNYMKKRGVKVLCADINDSNVESSIYREDGKSFVRLGLKGIKAVGPVALEKIIDERSKGQYKSIGDFLVRTKSKAVTRATVKSLLAAGCFDKFIDDDDSNIDTGRLLSFMKIKEDDYKKIRLNQYAISSRISKDPKVYCDMKLDAFSSIKEKSMIQVGAYIVDYRQIYTKKGQKMAFLALEDFDVRHEVTVFPSTFESITFIPKIGDFVIAKLYWNEGSRGGFVMDGMFLYDMNAT